MFKSNPFCEQLNAFTDCIAYTNQKIRVPNNVPYFLLFQKASTKILLYFIAIGQTVQPSSNAP